MQSSNTASQYESFKDMPFDKSLVHLTPIPNLRSRLSSAIIFSQLELKKSGIKILLLLSKTSNTYIKTSDGLPGFFKERHTEPLSWAFEVRNRSMVIEESDNIEEFATQYLETDLPTHLTVTKFDWFLRRNMLPMIQSIANPPTPEKEALLIPDFILEAKNMRGIDCKCWGQSEFYPEHCDDWRT